MPGIMKSNSIAKGKICAAWTVVSIFVMPVRVAVCFAVQDGNRHVVFQNLRATVGLKPVVGQPACWFKLASLTGGEVYLGSISPTITTHIPTSKFVLIFQE